MSAGRRGSGAMLSIPRRSPAWASGAGAYALGLGLVGVYALLTVAAVLAAPGLLPPLTLYSTVAALVLGYGLARLGAAAGARWPLLGATALMAVVAAKPLAPLAGLGGFHQALLDTLLLVTAGASLHRFSRLEGLHPRVAASLDRSGGLVVLSSFLLLVPLPPLPLIALAAAGIMLLRSYLLVGGVAAASGGGRK